jgi:hypothetical protein
MEEHLGNKMNVDHRGFSIRNADMPSMKKITTIGRGSIPDVFIGLFTSVGAAKRVIDLYVEAKGVDESGKAK